MQTYAPGSKIAGRYEVAGRPLTGGMGIVYVCYDHQEERPVALKTFKPEYLPDREARDRFLREGTYWVNLGAHPHVVRCYGVEYVGDGREVYLVLELVAKERGYPDASLRSWLIPGRPLPVETALLFALQIARGMAHATGVIPGFVHRDLKPENVLVGVDRLPNANVNRLRVTDFGLAAVLESMDQIESKPAIAGTEDASRFTAHVSHDPLSRTQLTHGTVGTPLYMAPEQWGGEPVGVYTDVYALGCIFYEMLNGQRAVSGGNLEALRHAHCAGEHCLMPADLPEMLRALLNGCLTVKTAERYNSWEAVEDALVLAYQALADHPAPAAEPPAALSRAERVAAGWSYNEIGRSYLDIGKADVTLGYFERARAAGEAEGERRLMSATLNYLGLAYAALGDAQSAIGHCERALAIALEIGDRQGEGAILINLGSAYAALGDVRGSIWYYEQSIAIAREIGDWRGDGNALGNLGEAYRNLGDVQRSIGYHEQALAVAYEIADQRVKANALNNLGNAYAQLGDARRAIGYYEQSLAIAREVGNQRGEGNALGNLGNVYLQLDEARRAIDYYEQALTVRRETGDRRGEGNDLGNLGVACLLLGDAQRAISFSEQQLVIAREIGDRYSEGNALGNLGMVYQELGDVRQAIGHYEQCLTIHREICDINGVATDSFNMALLHWQQGESTQALPLAQEAARIWAQIGSPSMQQAQRLVADLQGGGGAAPSGGPSPAQVLQQFRQVIEAVVVAAGGHRQARAVVEGLFEQFERGNWRIVEPIKHIWAGERDETALTADLNEPERLIVREILKRLENRGGR